MRLRLLAFLVLCSCATAVAQPLTIADALRGAHARNPELAAAQAQVHQAEADYLQAGSLPSTSFAAGASRGNGQASLASYSALPQDEYLQIAQAFPPFGSLSRARNVAWNDLQESIAQADQVEVTVTRQTKDAFFTLLASQERVQVLQDNLKLATQIYDEAVKETRNPRSRDVLAARVQRNQVDQALVQGAAGVQRAQADLAQAMGRVSGDGLTVVGTLETDETRYVLNELLALGERSPAVTAARAALASSREQVDLAASAGNPAPSLVGIYDFRIPSYFVGAQISIPLDLGQIGFDVQAKEHAAHVQDARLRALLLEISAEIHKAFADYNAAVINSARYEKEVLGPEEEAVRITQADFKANHVDYDQVLLAQQLLESIRLAYLERRQEERLALNALEAAVGSSLEGAAR